MAYDAEVFSFLNQQLKPFPPIDLASKETYFLETYTEEDARYFTLLLAKYLPKDMNKILKAYHAHDLSLLHHTVFRLYDALHFCPVPRLRYACKLFIKEMHGCEWEYLEEHLILLQQETQLFYNMLKGWDIKVEDDEL